MTEICRPVVVPGTNKVLVGSKAGYVYIVERTSPLSSSSQADCFATGGQISPGLTYWNGKVFTWGQQDNLRSFSLPNAPCSAPSNLAPLNSVPPPSNELGAAISISSNFDVNGLLWAYYPNSGSHRFDGMGQLLVYDPALVGTGDSDPQHAPPYKYIHSYDLKWDTDLQGDRVIKFSAPMVANGRVFVATQGQPRDPPLSTIAPRILVYAPLN